MQFITIKKCVCVNIDNTSFINFRTNWLKYLPISPTFDGFGKPKENVVLSS